MNLDFCPSCHHKWHKDIFDPHLYKCANINCTPLGEDDPYYCFIYRYSFLSEQDDILAWGVSMIAPDKHIYFLGSRSKEYYTQSKYSNHSQLEETTITNQNDEDIINIPQFMPFPIFNTSTELSSIFERLMKLQAFA